MNKNQLMHPDFGTVRIRKQKDDFLFCATDVCKILEHTNPRVAIQMLDEDERCKKSLPRQGETWFVTESGLYTLIMRSNKPEARKFRKWVTAEVLPSLRKYGVYSTNQNVMDRAKQKLEQRKVKELLAEIEDKLSATDKRLVAKQCKTDEWEVGKVLRGEIEDAYMLALLYSRATGNKVLRKSFYTMSGAEKLIKELNKN